MKPFEIGYSIAFPFLPNIYTQIPKQLFLLVQQFPERSTLLDVGGRKSHYTIGMPADIVISDLPRNTQLQTRLHLGINNDIIATTRKHRSNIREIVYDDMTKSNFLDGNFDGVVAVEVLENVLDDRQFLEEVKRVLKPGGFFLMSTPNGDYVKNTNPDHVRHYSRDKLQNLLKLVFPEIEIVYAVKSSKYYHWGLASWSPTKPFRTIKSMLGNFINRFESANPTLAQKNNGTRHLIVMARKH